jgi:dTDP-4-dehydrorhamnose 3,5-epimerase
LLVEPLCIPDVKRIVPVRHSDQRGYFSEVFRESWFRQTVADVHFVQENQSMSVREGTVRGLHFQIDPMAQGKLVSCITGSLLDVAVDIRHGSPTFGKSVQSMLSAANGHTLWIPAGFAHGFCTLEPDTLIFYKVTSYYSADHDRGILWNDPVVGIEWPFAIVGEVTVSEKDTVQPKLAEIPDYFRI